MKNLNNKSGFTLIEIVVVLIIVGILAAIAIPNLFSNINRSRGEEALAKLDSVKATYESCLVLHSLENPEQNHCKFATLFSNLPTNTTTSSFKYTATPGDTSVVGQTGGTFAGGNLTYSLVALDASNNFIYLLRNTNGSFTCNSAYNPFGGQNPYASTCGGTVYTPPPPSST